MTEHADLVDRIDLLEARAARCPADAALLPLFEDVLAEGYLLALTEEARSCRLTTRMNRLSATLGDAGAALEVRRLALERRSLDQRAAALRRRLAVIYEQFVLLGGASPSI